MPTLTFTRTISTNDLNRVVAALRVHFGMPNATPAQIQAEVDKMFFGGLVGIVKQYEHAAAAKSATDAVSDIALT
jgi:hypothetical protein